MKRFQYCAVLISALILGSLGCERNLMGVSSPAPPALTPTSTFSSTATGTATSTFTSTVPFTATPTPSGTSTNTPPFTLTPSPTFTSTSSNTPTNTAIRTATPSATSTSTVLSTPSLVPTVSGCGVPGASPAESVNLLAGNLYVPLKAGTGNVFFSPFSVLTAMSMAQEGANGNTACQMQTVLNLDPDATTRQQGFQQLISEINSPSKPYTLSTADNIWPQQNFPILPSFINTLQTYYGAGVTALNFAGDANGSAQTIDGAVSMETDGYIPNLVTPSDVSGAALVLTNAIYFEADWLSQFQTIGTMPQTFTLATGATESVSMMRQTIALPIGSFNGAASVVAIPYKGNEASMYVFLPPVGGMSALEAAMSGPSINSWLSANAPGIAGSSMNLNQVDLSLPKFTFSTNYKLGTTLIQMGMPLAFTRGQADFSGIDGNKDLYISQVIHQAHINVTESGTTAAAATAVIFYALDGVSTTYNPPPPIPFIVDHPFIFMIVDKQTNTILFMGRVNDPLSNS